MALPGLPYEENQDSNPPSPPLVVTVKLSKKKKVYIDMENQQNEPIINFDMTIRRTM